MFGVWLENRRLRVRADLAVPEPPAGEARIRVVLSGICNTDLELVRGYYPFTGIPGHEFVGIVEEGPTEWIGQRVVGEINAVCETCEACMAGRGSHCQRRTVLGIAGRNGSHAESLVLPVSNLHQVPGNISDEEALFTEPLAAALRIQEQVMIDANERVVVVGAGKLGQLIAQTLALTGCNLLVIGRNERKLGLLRARGIETADPADLSPASFDIAVECTGNRKGFALARHAVRPQGTIVMKSTYASDLAVNASSLVVDEITLIGSRCGPFDRALSLLSAREVDVLPMLDGRYPLEEALIGFEHAQRPGVLKVALRPRS